MGACTRCPKLTGVAAPVASADLPSLALNVVVTTSVVFESRLGSF